jgi:hypothetical protein
MEVMMIEVEAMCVDIFMMSVSTAVISELKKASFMLFSFFNLFGETIKERPEKMITIPVYSFIESLSPSEKKLPKESKSGAN